MSKIFGFTAILFLPLRNRAKLAFQEMANLLILIISDIVRKSRCHLLLRNVSIYMFSLKARNIFGDFLVCENESADMFSSCVILLNDLHYNLSTGL